MKANELMIGDWVLYPYQENEIRPGKIVNISESGSVGIVFDNGMEVATNLCYCKSVILTPEILEKNGWCSRMNGTGEFYLKKPLVDAAIVTKNIIGFQMNHGPFNGLSIYSVHELQHALRLCGIEKEIIV